MEENFNILISLTGMQDIIFSKQQKKIKNKNKKKRKLKDLSQHVIKVRLANILLIELKKVDRKLKNKQLIQKKLRLPLIIFYKTMKITQMKEKEFV